ncbi:MAG: methyl-accepting chemotaxis protein [Xenococcaceae cyanobacterium]
MTKQSSFDNPNPPPVFSLEPTKKNALAVKSQKPGEKAKKIKQSGISLRNQLLLTVLPIVFVPLGVGITIVYRINQKIPKTQIKTQLQEQALLAGEAARDLLEEELKLPAMVANNPLIIASARVNSQRAEAINLPRIPIEQIEKSFSATRLFQLNQELNDYLRITAKIGEVAQLSLTERNGFNIGYTIPPYDFVQRDEQWWQEAKSKGRWVSAPDFNPSLKLFSITIVQAIADPQSGEFLGVVKSVVSASRFDRVVSYLEQIKIKGSERVQIVDSSTGRVITTATAEGASSTRTLQGGEAVVAVSRSLVEALQEPKFNLEQVMSELQKQYSLQNLTFARFNPQTSENKPSASFIYQDRYYTIKTIPRINWVASASVDRGEIISADNELIFVFAITALVLGVGIVVVLLLLARQLSTPLIILDNIFKQVNSGDVDVVAQPMGNSETQALARSLNNLASEFKNLIQQQTKQDALQQELLKLLSKVKNSLGENEGVTNQLADELGQQISQINQMINSVEKINLALPKLAEKAKLALQISHDTSTKVKTGAENLSQTVDNLYQLHLTTTETVNKVKRIGELSQEIIQAFTPIEQISRQTKVLALNTNLDRVKIEAQHPDVAKLAEGLFTLAEHLTIVKTEIGQVIDNIQWKTSEVIEAMEQEISQIVTGNSSLEKTQQDFKQIFEVSQKLERLVQSIVGNTITQAQTSRSLIQLKEEMVQVAERTADSSIAVSSAWQEVFALTRQLSVSVENFKIGDET